MKELKELSANYATEKTNEMMSQIVAQAFADGYRMGYKDREDEIPVDLRDGKTEFVDLGLPSGTLWSDDYERQEGRRMYLTYEKTADYSIPSESQCEELITKCAWRYTKTSGFTCIGPNGNSIRFRQTGFMKVEGEIIYKDACYIWANCKGSDTNKRGMILCDEREHLKTVSDVFMGYRLPIRTVKNKQ